MIYDAIVIGAGPAGATAARRLAQQNLRVLILEKFKLPRYKPCGGGLTARAMQMIDFDISPAIEAEARNVLISYDSGPAVQKRFAQTAVWCVMRDKFDYLLAQQAVAAGAELHESVKVERVVPRAASVAVHSATERYEARFLVGADGATGITAKSAGLMRRRHDGAALESEIEVPSAVVDKWRNALLLDFGGIPWGYAWIFPKGEHLSIGIGTYRPSGKIKLREYLDRFVAKQPDLRGVMRTKGHLVPLGGRLEQFHAGRLVLAGDAAAMADPFLGEGISHAIHSGIIAAEEIGQAVRRGDADLSRHSRRINRSINSDFRFARLATNIFYRWPRHSFQAFIASGSVLDSAVGVLDGSLSYRRLVLDTLRQSPSILWRQIARKAGVPA